MNKKLFMTSLVALSLFTLIPATLAFGGFGGGRNQSEEVQNAFANGDYEAFQSAIAAGNINRFKNISEEDFAKRVERRAEAKEYRERMMAVIEAGDYDEWKNLVAERNADSLLLKMVTEDNFAEFAEDCALRIQANESGKRFGVGRRGLGHGGKAGATSGEMDGKRGGGLGGGRHFQN